MTPVLGASANLHCLGLTLLNVSPKTSALQLLKTARLGCIFNTRCQTRSRYCLQALRSGRFGFLRRSHSDQVIAHEEKSGNHKLTTRKRPAIAPNTKEIRRLLATASDGASYVSNIPVTQRMRSCITTSHQVFSNQASGIEQGFQQILTPLRLASPAAKTRIVPSSRRIHYAKASPCFRPPSSTPSPILPMTLPSASSSWPLRTPSAVSGSRCVR